MRKILLISWVLLFLSFESSSQSLVTDRPDQTESSFAVGVGKLQIESGFLMEFIGERDIERHIIAPSTLLRFGVLDHLEIRVVNQFDNLSIDDLELGFKIEIFDCNLFSTKAAFLSHVVLPTGSGTVSDGKLIIMNKLCFSHEVNNKIELGYNIGYDYTDNYIGDLNYSIALSMELSENIGVYLEPYGEIVKIESLLSSINTGVTYLFNNNFQLDSSFGIGINHTFRYISFGLSWRVG